MKKREQPRGTPPASGAPPRPGSNSSAGDNPPSPDSVRGAVAAVVLAAGLSRRMGTSKVLLPWTDNNTIIEHIVGQLKAARTGPVVVVTGHRSGEVAALVEKLGARAVFNPEYETGEMLSSLKAGLRALPDEVAAALIVLGDQPRLRFDVVKQILEAYAEGRGDIVAPIYEMRRGHPILVDRRYWPEFFALPEDGTPRDVIRRHEDRIFYVSVDKEGLPGDVDTPEEYERERGRRF